MDQTDNIVPLPSLEAIEAEAAAWLTALGREPVSAEDLVRFTAWIGQSDRHRRAFNQLSGLWDELAILKELEEIAVTDDPPASKEGLSRRKVITAAAACIPLAVATDLGIKVYRDHRHNQKGEFATRVGEQKKVQLADGSVVQLNTKSAIRVDYTESVRNVFLLYGEAYFDVAKNPLRPFSVFAAANVVTALGTAFTVRLHPDAALEVTVEEGRVALATASAKKSQHVVAELTARQSAVFSEKVERIVQMADAQFVQKLAWRYGVLAYAGVSLSDVVADVSRYTNVKIEIVDPTLRAKPIGGVFRVGELDALFDSLHVTFGLKIDRVNPKLVYISKAM